MSVDATTARSGLPPFYRRRRFWRNTVPVLAMIAAFLVGMGIFAALHHSNGLSGGKGIPLPKIPPPPKTVNLKPKELKGVHALVLRFVQTAVARKHLAEAYGLIGPGLREGFTLKQWDGGDVTAVPYPVDKKTRVAFDKKPVYSYARSVRYQVYVITPDEPKLTAQAGPNTFVVDLIKSHGRWLVNNWVPRWTPPIPNAGG